MVTGDASALPAPRRVSLSNRRETPFFRKDLGVDRLSVSFPIERFESDPRAWDKQTTFRPRRPGEPWTSSYSGGVELDGVGVFVGVQSMPSSGEKSLSYWGKLEFNPSRVGDPEGVSLATPGAARRVAERAWAAAAELLTPECSVGEARVKRVDVARDFTGLARPAGTIRALAPIHRPWARRNLVHADPSRHGAQTLMVGSGSGIVRLYDKAAESDGRAAQGTVRWEAECRPGWAGKYGHILRMDDLSEENLRLLAENRWEWSAMGAEVAATSRMVELVGQSGLSAREQALFVGWLVLQAHGGQYVPGFKAQAKWRKLQRDLGIALDGVAAGEPGSFVSRLDWEGGREVVRAA